MPTGYTADLETKKYNVKEWLKTSVIRAMGVCVTLRDGGSMSESEIINALKKEADNSYHDQKLKDAQRAWNDFKDLSPKQLLSVFDSEKKIALKEFEARNKEFEAKKLAHENATEETEQLYLKAKNERQGEVIVNTLKFALDQLQSAMGFDYGHGCYRDKVLDQSFDEWNAEKNKKLLWDLEYHAKELAKEEERNASRFTEYKKFIEFVDAAGARK